MPRNAAQVQADHPAIESAYCVLPTAVGAHATCHMPDLAPDADLSQPTQVLFALHQVERLAASRRLLLLDIFGSNALVPNKRFWQ